ncbi:DUF4142 domain-containing protein [Salinisphaera sp. LB1]|uniref:DUF4142 domain-containing protein n=1 Tax=Salinisphaera sp. LB1 TaxID=2183911 RepID=UPI000D705836|nr:DUF4142 domain-containing protein [Salinisphaera sp. LB1]AWN15003.1 putative exported protein [Salinisphaera sp. LB1]
MDIRRYHKFAVASATLALAAVPMVAGAAPSGLTAQHFVTEAAATNKLEIKLGKLAQRKSENPAVLSFAKKMLSDHTRLQHKLVRTAKSEHLKLPDSLPPKLQHKYQQLSQLSGRQFNKAYARFNVKGHEQAVALFKNEKRSHNDAAISKLAASGLPVIQHHLSMAKHMQQAVTTKS